MRPYVFFYPEKYAIIISVLFYLIHAGKGRAMIYKVPEESRIFMRDFPLAPGDLVVMSLSHLTEDEKPRIGKVFGVFSRNPDPGVTVMLATKEDFEAHTGGVHGSIKLSYYDSMWALIVFATPDGVIAKTFPTYELVQAMEENVISKISPEIFFDNHLNVLMHSKETGALIT